MPNTIINPPHQTGACKLASTVAGGCDHSARPLNKISTPYTKNSTPTKNHTGMILCFSVISSPENDLQNDKESNRYATPENGPVQQSDFVLLRDFGQAVHQALQFGVRPRLGHHRYEQRDHNAGGTRPQRLIHVLREALRVGIKGKQAYPLLTRFPE